VTKYDKLIKYFENILSRENHLRTYSYVICFVGKIKIFVYFYKIYYCLGMLFVFQCLNGKRQWTVGLFCSEK